MKQMFGADAFGYTVGNTKGNTTYGKLQINI